MNILHTIILSIIEGITEFLPISSTGHMMIAENILGMKSSSFLKLFTVAIQLGAILSVVVFYFKRFFNFKKTSQASMWGLSGWRLYILMVAGTIPAAVIGYLLNSRIEVLLDKTWIVVLMLFIGGIIMIFMDKYIHNKKETRICIPQAIIIGFYQCLAMIPGTSRSMATILGGMSQGLSRRQAAEFSFFLAIPIMLGATVLEVYKSLKDEVVRTELFQNMDKLLIGNAIAFIVALFAIKFFIGYVSKYGFRIFGVYRIVVSILLGILMLIGIIPTTLA